MVWCPLCEKKFQDRRGLHGHFRFVHGIEYGSGKPAKKTVLTDAIEKSIKRHEEGKRIAKEMEDRELKTKTKRVVSRNIGGESLRDYPKVDVFEGVDLGGVEIEKYGRRREPSWE